MSFTNPQMPIENPKRHYDKFGFLVSADTDSRESEFNKSRFRRKSPNYGRKSPRCSPNRREKDYRQDRNDREDRRKKRTDYSPDFMEGRTNKRDERMDFDSWETPYAQPQGFVGGPPPPSYNSTEPPPAPYQALLAYGQFNPVSYNFLEPQALDLGSDMNIPVAPPAPSLQPSNWAPANSVTMPQDDKVKREAIASEMRNQRATLGKQKEEYLKKASVLKRELDSLKQQRVELRGDPRRSPSPDSHRFLKENAKLQIEIQNKLKTVNTVIDMLNGIIGENPMSGESSDKSKARKAGQPQTPTQSPPTSRSSSADSNKGSTSQNKRKSRSKSRSKIGEKKFNYVFYDPEMHWCRVCNEFPSTAKEYLNHLHSPTHHRNALANLEAPWHDVVSTQNEGMPSYTGAPSKRTPIKGLQFFVPSTAWYCKLCDQWIGDLHCASAHLKSLIHSQNYANFTELNPHWEMDWMSDRQKNFEKVAKGGAEGGTPGAETKTLYSPHTISFQADGFHTKKKGNSPQPEKKGPQPKPDEKKEKRKRDKKKKKKRNRSSSDSSSSSSRSSDSQDERKNKKTSKDNENRKSSDRSVQARDSTADDRMLSQWMSSKQDTLTDQDKKILEKLKHRVKSRAGEKVEQKVDGRVVSREREAREVLTVQGNNSRSESLLHQSAFAPKSRNRDSENSKRHPDFKPYPGRRDKQDQNEERFDKQAEKSRKSTSTSSSTSDTKKMPFIGKMPLFKSLSNKPVKSDVDTKPVESEPCIEAVRKKRIEINAQIQKSVEEIKEKLKTSLLQKDPSIPAPGLALPTALGCQMPPMIIPLSTLQATPVPSYPQTIHKIQKSPTPIPRPPEPKKESKSEAKSAKKETLHKDFQDALDIIFPSENAPKPAGAQRQNEIMDPNINLLTQIPPPSMNQAYPQMMPQNYPMGPMGPNHMGPMGQMGSMGPMGPPPMNMMGMPGAGMMGWDYSANMYPTGGLYDMPPHMPMTSESLKSHQEQDDLAMLGIDAEDVGAGGF